MGRDVASIFCMVLMASICSYPTENGDVVAGLLRASVKSSKDRRASSLDDCFLRLAVMWAKFYCIDYPLCTHGW